MPTDSDIKEMERACRQQRQDNARHFLRINEAKKSGDGDVTLAKRVLEAAANDTAAFDRALRNRKVQDLFRAGVLFLAQPKVPA